MSEPGFDGLLVVALESRMAAEMTRLIERYRGRPLVAPALREIPLHENPEALAFGDRLLAGEIDLVILETGVGTSLLLDILQTRHPPEVLHQALSAVTIVARGPKPIAALKRYGLSANLVAPEPNTWEDVIRLLDESKSPAGLRVAVQEYGAPNDDLYRALTARGAIVTRVPVYRWALPEDTAPLADAVSTILAGRADVLLITNAMQVDHLMVIAGRSQPAAWQAAIRRMFVGSIGPTASARLRHFGFPVDLEPSHPKMGILVKEAAKVAPSQVKAKRLPR